jgi:hypothetical protein
MLSRDSEFYFNIKRTFQDNENKNIVKTDRSTHGITYATVSPADSSITVTPNEHNKLRRRVDIA